MTDHTDMSINGRPFFCSWSGGKDSCLALYHAKKNGGAPRALFTMLSEDGITSRSHALPKSLIEKQAKNLGLKPVFGSASWNQYETVFISALKAFKQSGIEVGVFGDIDVDPHLKWVQRVCGEAGIQPVLPLWKRERRELLDEFISLGFTARVIVVNGRKLEKRFLGKALDSRSISEMAAAGIDPSGELGEYHSVVTNGPIFSSSVEIDSSEQVSHDGYWFLKTHLKSK